MNSLSGKISDIRVSGNLSIVSIDIDQKVTLKSIIIENPVTSPYLKNGHQINVLFKETEVVIGKNEKHAISLQNRITGKVKNIERGELISKVIVKTEVGEIVAIISSNAVMQLELQIGSEVIAMVKLNETMLSE